MKKEIEFYNKEIEEYKKEVKKMFDKYYKMVSMEEIEKIIKSKKEFRYFLITYTKYAVASILDYSKENLIRHYNLFIKDDKEASLLQLKEIFFKLEEVTILKKRISKISKTELQNLLFMCISSCPENKEIIDLMNKDIIKQSKRILIKK